MRLRTLKTSMMLLACFAFVAISAKSVKPTPTEVLPNPVLNFIGQEPFSTGGKDFTRYTYEVFNFDVYPKELFLAAPELPQCGVNTKASRTWVDLYDQRGKRLNGFCALASSKDLNTIWFALERNVIPPSYIYIEMTDRKTDTKYKSNLAETTL
jgi:hypothetical protein